MVTMILLMLAGSQVTGTSEGTVFVHEWGVVLIDEVLPMACGAERGYLEENGTLQPYYSMAVDAPVIWFHGPEFTGTLTVEVQNGFFSLLIPLPASSSISDESIPVFQDEENYFAVWQDLSFTDELSIRGDIPADRRGVESATDELSISGDMPADRRGVESAEEGFQWAMPFWREVPALIVSYDPASYVDRFIYYECSATNLFEEQEPSESYQNGSLLFHEEDGELAADLVIAPLDRIRIELGVSDDGILDVLADWGGNEFLNEEIEALWKTWKPSLLTRCILYGETVVLFPLTDEQVESISTIDLQTEQGYRVEYSRLFLALGSM